VECGHSDTHEEYAVKRQGELTATSSTERQQSWLETCLLDTCLLCSVMTGVWCMQDSVYVKFVSEAAAGQGFRALHGWMYDGRNSAVSFPSRDRVLMILFFCAFFLCCPSSPRQHTHPLSGTTRVSRYQKGKTSLDFTEARDSVWQWHQLGHMQVCTSLQTGNHSSTSPAQFFTGRMPCLPPNQQCQSTEGRQRTVKWLHADACVWGTLHVSDQMINRVVKCLELRHLTVQVTI